MTQIDLIPTAKKIARVLGCTERRTQYLCETSQIPAFKIGNIWHARRKTLERYLEELEAEALERARAAGGSS